MTADQSTAPLETPMPNAAEKALEAIWERFKDGEDWGNALRVLEAYTSDVKSDLVPDAGILTPERLAEIRARYEATTQGTWEHDGPYYWPVRESPTGVISVDERTFVMLPHPTNPIGEEDLRFAVHAHADVPDLLAEVERLRCTDPIECGHEAALGQAQEEVKQLRAAAEEMTRHNRAKAPAPAADVWKVSDETVPIGGVAAESVVIHSGWNGGHPVVIVEIEDSTRAYGVTFLAWRDVRKPEGRSTIVRVPSDMQVTPCTLNGTTPAPLPLGEKA